MYKNKKNLKISSNFSPQPQTYIFLADKGFPLTDMSAKDAFF